MASHVRSRKLNEQPPLNTAQRISSGGIIDERVELKVAPTPDAAIEQRTAHRMPVKSWRVGECRHLVEPIAPAGIIVPARAVPPIGTPGLTIHSESNELVE